jgi:hypothetical protein
VGILSAATHGGAQAQGVAALLTRLLEAHPCPAELIQLAERYEGSAGQPPDALERFARELSFFERPGREDLLRQLADRAVVVVEQSRAAEALDRLTERARLQAEELPTRAAPRVAEAAVSAKDLARRLAVPAAVAVLLSLGLAFGVATLLTPAEAPEPRTALPVPPTDEEVAVETARPGPAAPAPRAAPVVRVGRSTPAEGARTTPPGRDRVLPVEPAANPVPGTPPPGGSFEVRVKELGGAALPPDPVAAAPAERRSMVVYGAGDRGVQPAVLIRPHLPPEPPPDVPADSVGTLELTVSETGSVEHVRLISPSNRFQERMLVAAAKTWLFRPATKDGHPVRFRAQVRVTL